MPANRHPSTLGNSRSLTSELRINPRFATWCGLQNLRSANDFLALPGEIISGHRDRHVIEVRLDDKKLFLKKEHRVPLNARLRNWRDGFGFVSFAEREAAALRQLRQAGVPVPEWIACGRSRDCQAFVLLRNARGKDLRVALANATSRFGRWRLASAVGEAVGRLHQAGFDAPDLSAKHVLVRDDGGIVLIDWPRTKWHKALDQDRCLRALANLHSSLAHHLATPRERFTALKTWMRTLGFHGRAAPLARQVIRVSKRIGWRRSIDEQLQVGRDPRLFWVDGEGLCVTKQFWQSVDGYIPDWLRQAARTECVARSVDYPAADMQLMTFQPAPRWQRWLARLTGRPIQSAAIRQAGLSFRLRRRRVPLAPVVAFGSRANGRGFLLCRRSATLRSARSWLGLPRPGRRAMLKKIGQLLRRCHDAGCRGIAADALAIEKVGRPRLRLIPDGNWMATKKLNADELTADLKELIRGLGIDRQQDAARIIRGYYHSDAVNKPMMRVAANVLCPSRRRAA